jgi:SAM-dependent methyltransferase
VDAVRTSYDTVAASYADIMRDVLADKPYLRSVLTLFAELVPDGVVADVGCGPGHVTAYLCDLGMDAIGIDLSPAMIDVARRDHPGPRFEVGTMTDLDFADGAFGGLLAWWSLIHLPDAEVPAVLAEFRRVLRPGGVLLLGFHAGDVVTLKTQGYGGHPMHVHVHRRPAERVASWLRDLGFTIEAQAVLSPDDLLAGAILFARKPTP